MTPQPPPGQGPVDPRGAFAPPPPPNGGPPMMMPPPPAPPGGMPPFPPPPPPGYYPPPPPPYYPRPQRSFARAIFTTLASSVLGFSLLANVYLLFASGLLGDRTASSNVIQDGDATQKIAVVPIINSMITAKSADQLDKLLRQVAADADVKALVLRVDTPGGEVAPSDRMYHLITAYKAQHPHVPVVVSMGSLATSGGYYAAVAADYLVAEPATLTVNVGVYSENLNVAGLLQKYGVEDTTIRSDGTPYKTAGSPLHRPTTQEVAYLQAMVDSFNQRFRQVVTTGRQGLLKAGVETVCNGKAYNADEALSLGAIDQVGYLDDAWKYAAKKAGLTRPQVVRFEPPSTLAELLGGGSDSRSLVPTPGAAGGIHLDLPALDSKLDEVLDPRPMAMYRPQ
jgi:signal peptide peptidase SppA